MREREKTYALTCKIIFLVVKRALNRYDIGGVGTLIRYCSHHGDKSEKKSVILLCQYGSIGVIIHMFFDRERTRIELHSENFGFGKNASEEDTDRIGQQLAAEVADRYCRETEEEELIKG